MLGRYTRREVTISDGEALSDALKMNGLKLVGIVQPADCEGTAFGLKASYDEGANYVAVYNAIQESTGAAPVTALWEVTKSSSPRMARTPRLTRRATPSSPWSLRKRPPS
jgi:hypothetical protein